jgi:hypothetical protein
MMKKVAIFGLSLVLLLAGLAYINQIPLMLALVKIQSSMAYEVGPPRDLPWSEGPAHASSEPGARRVGAYRRPILINWRLRVRYSPSPIPVRPPVRSRGRC